ncbi:MAG TPA: GNAT family N-acetyltransferase [Gaiellaceae bacterium]
MKVLPVTPERWPDLVALFEQRGPRGGHRNTPAYGCWCMWWRDRSLAHGEPKKRAMAKLVRAGREPGLLVYDAGRAVGWVAVAPREEFAALMRSPQYRPHDEEEGVWAVTCFVVDKPEQRRGVAAALLDAAVAHAFGRGAAVVEAYPHLAKGDDYMGALELYERAGFRRARTANKRAIVRLER